MSDIYERVHLVKNEVFVYRIPPLQSNRGCRAADWKLDSPDWTGRLRLVSLDSTLHIKLEDKASGQLFAKAPIDKYPGMCIESVLDSSRYFVLRLLNDNGQSAFIGLGFADRGDSFDLNVALQDYFKDIQRDEKVKNEVFQEGNKPKLDLGFKDGQTITINLGGKKGTTAKPKSTSSGFVPLLPPPPPSGTRVAPTQVQARNRPFTSGPADADDDVLNISDNDVTKKIENLNVKDITGFTSVNSCPPKIEPYSRQETFKSESNNSTNSANVELRSSSTTTNTASIGTLIDL